jgi:hypothetical protein
LRVWLIESHWRREGEDNWTEWEPVFYEGHDIYKTHEEAAEVLAKVYLGPSTWPQHESEYRVWPFTLTREEGLVLEVTPEK